MKNLLKGNLIKLHNEMCRLLSSEDEDIYIYPNTSAEFFKIKYNCSKSYAIQNLDIVIRSIKSGYYKKEHKYVTRFPNHILSFNELSNKKFNSWWHAEDLKNYEKIMANQVYSKKIKSMIN